MGRPLRGKEPRDIKLNIRISKQESELIQECANKTNQTRTDAIIQGINLLKETLEK